MLGRAGIGCRGTAGCIPDSPRARWLAARSPRVVGRTLPRERAGCHKPRATQDPAPLNRVVPQKSEGLLEGFCPEPLQEEQIAVNSNGLMLFLRLADIEWLEAVDNGVALHVGKKTHLLRETLAAVAAKLPPGRFLRIGPSALVNRAQVIGLQPMFHGRCGMLLYNGTRLTLICDCGEKLRQIGWGNAASTRPLVCSRFTIRGHARN
jgi:hypothetical protein